MDQNVINENVDTLFHGLENFTQREGIIGKSYVEGEKTFIPVLSVTLGYGSGNAAAKNQGQQDSMSPNSTSGALGLGARLCTDAIIMIDNANNGAVTMLPTHTNGSISHLVDKIPQMMAGMKNSQNQSQ